MSAHITRSRVVAAGVAVLALAVTTGCGGASQTPTGRAAPSGTAAPAMAPAGPVTLTKTGTTLKFGEVANVRVDYLDKWVGGLKVTALEKAPVSDYKDLGVEEGAGTVYYLRYDITYLSGGDARHLPMGSNMSSSALHPDRTTQDQRRKFVDAPDFKKCSQDVFKADGQADLDKKKIKLGETATNMCHIFTVDKGTLTQVEYKDYADTAKEVVLIWK